VPSPLRERAQRCAHELEWVRGFCNPPLTHPPRAAASSSPLPQGARAQQWRPQFAALSHDVTQPIAFPRRVFRARGCATLLRQPESRGGRSAEKRFGCVRGTVGRAILRQRRAWTRLWRGTLASRRSTVAVLGSRGRASLTGTCAGSVTASSSHPGRSAWRAGSRASRGERLRRHSPQDATPRSAFGIVSRTRPQWARLGVALSSLRIVVK